jgi:hypothetical protein
VNGCVLLSQVEWFPLMQQSAVDERLLGVLPCFDGAVIRGSFSWALKRQRDVVSSAPRVLLEGQLQIISICLDFVFAKVTLTFRQKPNPLPFEDTVLAED